MRLLLAPRDAARLLGVSVSRLQQLDREGRIRSIRDSASRWLFRELDVLQLRQERGRQGHGAGTGTQAPGIRHLEQ